MIPYIDKSLSGKIEFIYKDVVVKKGVVLTPEEQVEFNLLREALHSKEVRKKTRINRVFYFSIFNLCLPWYVIAMKSGPTWLPMTGPNCMMEIFVSLNCG